MFGEYEKSSGRELLKEMVANRDEDVMPFYEFLNEYYPHLLDKPHLTEEEARRYNSLVVANIPYIKVQRALLIRAR